MDPNATQQPPTYTPPTPQPNLNQSYTPPPQPREPRKINLTWILIFMLILIIFGLLGFIYMNQNNSISPTPTPTPIVTEDNLNDETVEESEETQNYTSAKLKNLSFSGYTLTHPISWSETEDRNENSGVSKLTLTKDDYSLVINQGPMGGAICIYEGDLPNLPAIDNRNKDVEDLTVSIGNLRKTIEISNNKTVFGFCQENEEEPGTYGSFTTVGALSATAPLDPDPEIIEEMNEIINSITTL